VSNYGNILMNAKFVLNDLIKLFKKSMAKKTKIGDHHNNKEKHQGL